jgi:hypothetical protein
LPGYKKRIARLKSAIRTDLIIALCALLVSTLTAAAVIYQGKILSSQLSVSIWPYVAFQTTASQTVVELQVQNVGAGPALVRSASLLVDGAPQPSLAAGLRKLGYRYAHGDEVTLSSIGPGEVLRAAESISVARVQSTRFAKLAATLQQRVRVHICYCSILGDCWLAQSDVESPIAVKSCDAFPRGAVAAQ